MTVSFIAITLIPGNMFQQEDENIQMSAALAKHWHIRNGQTINLQIGAVIKSAAVSTAHIGEKELLVNTNVLEQWKLPQKQQKFLAVYDESRQLLRLGPVIGVLTDFLEEDGRPNFRSIQQFCRELDEACKSAGGILFVFHLKDYHNGKIKGFCYEEDQWIKQEVPLPNVIYNRIHSRQLEKAQSFRQFKDGIHGFEISMFNDRFLSKDDAHELLISEKHMQPYLPHTALAKDETIISFLSQYNAIFIKPANGSQGRGIIRAERSKNEIISKSSSGKGLGSRFHFDSDAAFLHWLLPMLQNRTFIVQQAISLISYHRKPLDFRVLCHRNFQDKWKATSAVARISAEEQFVSNLARGGELAKPAKILTELFDQEKALKHLSLMKELAIEASMVISKRSEGIFAELGVDIGIDNDENLWIIEVNAKPSKNSDVQTEKARPSAQAIVEYCIALTFPPH